MDTSNPKSAIVETIKKSTNILVTVSHNPSVDALAAALGFTLMLNKLDKHATAVFSGAIPPAITFLEPEKTFEGTVSSLRDFIIALDKEKADRLRYKVEGDVVRIYITPYKTTITQNDLQYSEGDFNIDLVLALGVEKQSDLDSAISAHGRILHDATVATINLSSTKSSVGTIDWSDEKASSLCEMLMSLSEAIQSNLLDEQIATALLTGIVAATDRFSNSYTTPRVMTMSAQLMAAGANQQLISEKLQAGGESLDIPASPRDGSTHLAEGESKSLKQPQGEELPPSVDGEMHISHLDGEDIANTTKDAERYAEEASEDRKDEANAKLEEALGHVSPVEHLREELEHVRQSKQANSKGQSTDWRDHVHDPYGDDDEPIMGGTLNATTSEAEAAKRAEERSARNHTILSHDVPPATAVGLSDDKDEGEGMFGQGQSSNVNSHDVDSMGSSRGRTIQPVTMQPIKTPFIEPVEPLPEPPPMPPLPRVPEGLSIDYEESPMPPPPSSALPPAPAPESQHNQTLADLEAEVHAAANSSPVTSSIDDARSAVNNAFGTQPLSVGGQFTQPPTDLAPPMPDFSTLPPLPPAPGSHPASPQFPVDPAPSQGDTPGQFQIPNK